MGKSLQTVRTIPEDKFKRVARDRRATFMAAEGSGYVGSGAISTTTAINCTASNNAFCGFPRGVVMVNCVALDNCVSGYPYCMHHDDPIYEEHYYKCGEE